ncbi:hypothetical protein ACIHCM_25535 [Streptomyces sp. NPDC052023]|uniref:hypothetical protein n=1 Tax=Streptomyces sp. NPDC052023 TaxID=3365681 RepID=UPI0037CDE13C
MRRSARVLSVAVIAGGAWGGAVPLVSADPAAEVSPASAQPGGSVTVAVTCDPLSGAAAPEVIEATSEAFAESTVQLQLVPGDGAAATGLVYEGSALMLPASVFEADPAAAAADSVWTVDGTCPAAAGAQGKAWTASFTVPRKGNDARPACSDGQEWCQGATVEHGVRAGGGGAFNDSVPALVAGGLLIAGAAGAAGHRLWRRDTPGDA